MSAFINLLGGQQQKCYAHGLHLVVTEILYNKKSRIFDEAVLNTMDQLGDNLDLESDEIQEIAFNLDTDDMPYEIKSEYMTAVDKTRSICRFIRGSNNNMNSLRKYTDIKPELDCRTRWSSLFDMLEQFDAILPAIKKAAIDNPNFDAVMSDFSADDEKIVKKILKFLRPIRVCTDKISKSGLNLLDAENILDECYRNIEDPLIKNIFKARM